MCVFRCHAKSALINFFFAPPTFALRKNYRGLIFKFFFLVSTSNLDQYLKNVKVISSSLELEVTNLNYHQSSSK